MNQFFTFMIDWALKSVVTAAFGSVFVLLLRGRSAATRHMVWRVTLAAILLLPLAMVLTPKAGAPVVMEPIQGPVRTAIARIEIPKPEHGIKSPALAAFMAQADKEGTMDEQLLGMLYGAGLIVMLGSWALSYLRVRRIASGAALPQQTSGGFQVFRARTPELRVPITFGLLRPVILLPLEAESWPEQRVQAAILHESAHIVRNDWGWQTASHLLRAAQWFNPAVWLIHAALRTTSEAATDDEVLTQFNMGPSAYANELLKVAEAARSNVYVATAMARKGGVAGRLQRIVATGIDRGRPQRSLVFGTGLVFSVAGLLVAAGTVAEANGAKVADGAARLLSKNPVGAALLAATGGPAAEHSAGKFEAKLSHGGYVRMVAMTGPRNGEGPIWGPGGGQAPSTEKKLMESFFHQHNAPPAPGERVINFYLQVAKLPMEAGESENGIFRIKSPGGWEYRGGSNTMEPDGRVQWDQWVAPSSVRTCDMDCAISYGKYTPVGKGKLGDGQFHSHIGDAQGDYTIVTFHLPGKFGGDEAKLECFDADGKLVGSGHEAMWGNDDDEGQRYDFSLLNDDLKKTVTYRFSRRPYEHVVIRGIVLPPTTIQP